MTKKDFMKKAAVLYGNKYDYHCVQEEMLNNPAYNMPIVCPKHGLFFESVYDHLLGKGCFECDKEKHINP